MMSASDDKDDPAPRDDGAPRPHDADDERLTNVEPMLGPTAEPPPERDPGEDDYINRMGSLIDRSTGQRHWPGGTPGGGSSGNA